MGVSAMMYAGCIFRVLWTILYGSMVETRDLDVVVDMCRRGITDPVIASALVSFDAKGSTVYLI